MNTTQVLRELETLGTAQNRKTYERHGVSGPMYGVSYASLGALKKRIKIDHALALELWASGNHDARVLATTIADPSQLDGKTLDAWVQELRDYVLTDAFVNLAARAPHARKKADRWARAKPEYVSAAGWKIIAQFALRDPSLPDDYFREYLRLLPQNIHSRPNRTKEAMNNALIAIGTRNAVLEHEALETAAQVGQVTVDHGLTNCKTPDAASYILRTVQKRGFALDRLKA